ncbi:MAG: hypothetical protein H7A25_10090 [Leptospiraceae bacterium]|nr:hypothetical protein [Leptospiraceae bacterium]MCP5500241.1 hypothetical protein [Leptospiraceae bacterium]
MNLLKKQAGLFMFLALSLSFLQGEPNTDYPKTSAKGIRAYLQPDNRSIRIEWVAPEESGKIILARSKSRIDTLEKLYIADSLGKYASDPMNNPYTSHLDQNIEPGSYYYAVVLMKTVRDKTTKLIADGNFTTIPIIIPVPPPEVKETKKEVILPEKPIFIESLSIVPFGKRLELKWNHPSEANLYKPVYTIYLSSEPLSTLSSFTKAMKINRVNYPENSYLLPELVEPGKTYYVGVSSSYKEKEYTPLEENKSFVSYTAIEKKEEPKPETKEELPISQSFIKNLNFEPQKDKVLLLWNPPDNAVKNETIYHVYHAYRPMNGEGNPLITGEATKVASLYHPETIFLLPSYDKTRIQFVGITVSNRTTRENPSLEEKNSFVKLDPEYIMNFAKKTEEDIPKETVKETKEVVPEKKEEVADTKEETKKEEKVEPEKKEVTKDDKEIDSSFRTIMIRSFKKQNYKETIKALQEHLKGIEQPEKRARALFFTALSHFRLGEFQNALNILVQKEVKDNYDKERVDFYIKRCLEYRQRGME